MRICQEFFSECLIACFHQCCYQTTTIASVLQSTALLLVSIPYIQTTSTNDYLESNHTPHPYKGTCQLCGVQEHSAKRCPSFRYIASQHHGVPPNYSYRPSSAQTHATTQPTVVSPNWVLDFGASHHISNDLQNLSLHSDYAGPDDIIIGDGKGLEITHTGSTTLPTALKLLQLNNILCVLTVKKNLISISQFCLTNNVFIEFLSTCFYVNDLCMGARILHGPTSGGFYVWLNSPTTTKPLIAFSSVKTSLPNWHHRLGHPSSKVLQNLVSSKSHSLSSNDISTFACNSCKCNKSRKLPFSASSITSSSHLQTIYSYVWSSPIVSNDNFKYYVIFVDHFTKYVWLYPLQKKSNV